MTGYEAHERSTLKANINCQRIHPQACLLKEVKAKRGDLDQTVMVMRNQHQPLEHHDHEPFDPLNPHRFHIMFGES